MRKYRNKATGVVVRAEEVGTDHVYLAIIGFGTTVNKKWFYENYKPA